MGKSSGGLRSLVDMSWFGMLKELQLEKQNMLLNSFKSTFCICRLHYTGGAGGQL